MVHDSATQRQHLIASLSQAGVYNKRVLEAISSVPRELFVDENLQQWAYADRALPIGMGQTISQPLMVALMTQALQLTGQERVLEIGTGSGYQAAILSKLTLHVYSIERYQELAYQAALHLTQLALQNISLFIGDGSLGWPDEAPYDRILVTAAAPSVPSQLLAQLVMGGWLVIPVGGHNRQELQVIQSTPAGTRVHFLGSCVFVPLVGEKGWHEEE